jgi:hypothetical protein
MSKTIIVHVANRSMLDANIAYRTGTKDERIAVENSKSSELHYVTEALLKNGWNVYWALLENIDLDTLHFRQLYDVQHETYVEYELQQLNDNVDVILARVLGSVEGKLATVKRYFERLQQSFNGITVNDPASVILGLRKDYLFELINAGFNTIATDYYESTVSFAELETKYAGRLHEHIVKPVTGELSNSLKILRDTGEQFFRHKESKVGGWLVQPVMPEIWDGEYQLFFLGDNCTHANKKVYVRSDEHPIIPSQENRLIDPYEPSNSEIALARQLKQFYIDFFGVNTDIFRLDFMKDADGTPIIVEFETVNPGFFIRYISDDRKLKIAEDFEAFLSKRVHILRSKS